MKLLPRATQPDSGRIGFEPKLMELGIFTASWNGRVPLAVQGAAHPCVSLQPVLTPAGNAVLSGSQLVQCPTPLG